MRKYLSSAIFLFSLELFLPLFSLAEDSEIEQLKRRISELEKKQQRDSQVLAEEIEKTKLSSLIPEKAELKSDYGLGPAASGVYKLKQGLSLGGYAEATYRKFVSDKGSKKDQSDFLRFVMYLGYKFNDWIVFNSEIEIEHGTSSGIGDTSGDKSGSVSVEFAYLDFLLREEFNPRIGMLLVPMGFVNEIHEPPYFHGVARPELERRIIPTTWRENGFWFLWNFGSRIGVSDISRKWSQSCAF